MSRMKKILSVMVLMTACTAAFAQLKDDFYSGEIYHEGWIDLNKNGVKDVYEDPSADIEARIDDLLCRMTLEEKTCQMVTLYGYRRVLQDELPTPAWKEKLWKDGIGAIDEHLNGFRNWDLPLTDSKYLWPASLHAKALNTVQQFFIEQTRLGIPTDFTNEGIRGVEAYRATNFPTQLGIGHTWDRELVHRIGYITGREGRLLGYTNVYAPILDVGRDQRWGRYEEIYGESPYLVAELGFGAQRSQGVVIGFGQELDAAGGGQRLEAVENLRAEALELVQGGAGNGIGNLEFALMFLDEFQHELVHREIALLRDTACNRAVGEVIIVMGILADIEKSVQAQPHGLMDLEIQTDALGCHSSVI